MRHLDAMLDFGDLVGMSVLLLVIVWTWTGAENRSGGLWTSIQRA